MHHRRAPSRRTKRTRPATASGRSRSERPKTGGVTPVEEMAPLDSGGSPCGCSSRTPVPGVVIKTAKFNYAFYNRGDGWYYVYIGWNQSFICSATG